MSEPRVMSADEAFRFLREIMVREFELSEDQIQLTSGLQDLGLDSIDAVDLAIWIEDATGLEFTTEDMVEFKTLQDVVALLSGGRPTPAG